MKITRAAHHELETRLLVLVGEFAPASDKARGEADVLAILARCDVVDTVDTADLTLALTGATAEAHSLQLIVEEQRSMNDTLATDVARLSDINTRVTGELEHAGGELERLRTQVSELETTLSDLRAAQPPPQADSRPSGDSTA